MTSDAEVERLREAMTSRAGIEQACGVLMALVPCSLQVARELLVEISQQSNVKLRTVTAALVDTISGRLVPPEVDLAFRQALARQRQRDSTDR